eukprot:6202150-Amphidinium_carterae.2
MYRTSRGNPVDVYEAQHEALMTALEEFGDSGNTTGFSRGKDTRGACKHRGSTSRDNHGRLGWEHEWSGIW